MLDKDGMLGTFNFYFMSTTKTTVIDALLTKHKQQLMFNMARL